MKSQPVVEEVHHRFSLPLKDEDELRAFIKVAWGVTIPDTQVCPHHTTPWRAFADAYFARSPVSVWVGSRGFGGKSMTLSVLGLTEGSTLKASVSILGGSGAQSERVHNHMKNLWHYENAPRHILRTDPSQFVTKLHWGNTIEALMASQTSVRGPHPQRLRMDEIDEMDMKILEAAQGQPMSGDTGIETQTVLSSTHQYANGTMTKILKRAKEMNWPVYEWCWRETSTPIDGWLKPEEVDRKRIEITREMWETEYDLQRPSVGALAIMPQAVERLFDERLGKFAGEVNEYIEIEPPMFKCSFCSWEMPVDIVLSTGSNPGAICTVCGHDIERVPYIHGADWARKQDWTIIPTFRADRLPLVCVAWERTGRLEWPAMVDKLDKRIERFGVGNSSACEDGTGIGDVISGYHRNRVEAIIMAGVERYQMLNRYIGEIESDHIRYPMIRWAYDEHAEAGQEDVFGSSESHHLPDSISAGSLALKAFRMKRVTRMAVAGASPVQGTPTPDALRPSSESARLAKNVSTGSRLAVGRSKR